ncbi:GDSL esterase/lipase 1-like protein [Tanacetum coccineum]
MAVANRKPSFLLLIIAVVVLCPLTRIDCHENIHKEVAVFVFRDSLFDPRNNNYINIIPVLQANYRPYGESYFSPPTGRFSNGLLISDFISEYARLPLIPPYLEPGNNVFTYGANFASAGAGALIETLPGLLQYFSDVENLYRQSLGDTKAEQLLSNSVYLFSCGASDYISHVPNSISMANIYPTLTNEQYTELVIGNLTSVIKGIYKKGGRKFGFLTIPLIGCFSEGETSCCGSGPLRGIFSYGGKRGIPDYELCDNVTEYLFFDSLHPNELASIQFAKMFWKGDPMVTRPYNLKALFDGCLSSQQAALFVFGDSLFDPGNNHHSNTTADFQANF